MALGEFPIQKLAGDPGFVHEDDMSCPVQLDFEDHCFNTGGISSLEVRYLVLPVNPKDRAEAVHVECL